MSDADAFSLGVTRRTFMAGVGGVAALSLVGTSAKAAAGKEAPDLAALVKDGNCHRWPTGCRKTQWL